MVLGLVYRERSCHVITKRNVLVAMPLAPLLWECGRTALPCPVEFYCMAVGCYGIGDF